MNCPRCSLMLAGAEYEGEQVLFCSTCWGYWLKRKQLDQIIHAVDYRFAKKEAETVERVLDQVGDADREGSERKRVACPECGAVMAKKNYVTRCPVQVDECDDHGIWLDTGEIKDLQVFIERSMS